MTRLEDLPVRIVGDAPSEPVIAVDGAFGAAGLELSHWPGNRTPTSLRHDLSTGAALAFARLAPDERARLAGEAAAIVNNHYDTDGTCALFAVHRPEAALARAERLLACAAAGDFFRLPDLDALAVDALVEGLVDPERSPLELAGLGDRERWQRATEHLMERLPAILDGDLEPYRDLWMPAVDAARHELSLLPRFARDDDEEADLTVWTAPRSSAGVDLGRHVLFGSSTRDRALVVAPANGGTRYRLVLSTLSWFDLASGPRRERPGLAALAERLNEIEGTRPSDPGAWRAQSVEGPSPELWFGGDDVESYAEHNAALRPSSLAPAVVRGEVVAALRSEAPAGAPAV